MTNKIVFVHILREKEWKMLLISSTQLTLNWNTVSSSPFKAQYPRKHVALNRVFQVLSLLL